MAQVACSQHITFGYQIGYGTYSMKPLENLNYDISKNLQFDAKVVDNFPGYLYFRPSVSLELPRYSIGLIYTFQSTGSRVSARDFSGEYRFDTKVRSIAPGIYSDITIMSMKKCRLCFSSIVGLLYSKLNIQESLIIQSIKSEDQKMDFKSQNYFIEPGFVFYYSLGSFDIGLNADYSITIGKQAFYSGESKKNTLHNNYNQQDIKPDWNGIRAGFSLLYTIGSKQ